MNDQQSDSWQPPYIVKKYGIEFVLALVILTILDCIYVIHRIRYGKLVITKKTLTPYYTSLIYLILLLVETVERCIVTE